MAAFGESYQEIEKQIKADGKGFDFEIFLQLRRS